MKAVFDRELTAFRAARFKRDHASAWNHLERAHIFSQSDVWLHTKAHWEMLVFAAQLGDVREVVGQITRVVVAGIGTALGKAPPGNTGRANVPLMASMEIPPDIQETLEKLDVNKGS